MLVKTLADVFGPPGQEFRVRDMIRARARDKGCNCWTDAMGNLFAVPERNRKGEQELDLLLVAHMDEVGFMVTGHQRDGLLRFRCLGGIDQRLLPGKLVELGPEGIPGVIGSGPVHLEGRGKQQSPAKDRELYIDIGSEGPKEAAVAAPVGTGAVFSSRAETLESGLLRGKAFDDRAGCAALLELVGKRAPITVGAAFTVQEELGLRGSRVAGRQFRARKALVIEATTAADVPDGQGTSQVTQVGKGPALTLADGSTVSDPGLLEQLGTVAATEGIAVQYKESNRGSTDGGPIQQEGGGVPTAVISVPCRYLHGPASLLDPGDWDELVRLLRFFVEKGAGKK